MNQLILLIWIIIINDYYHNYYYYNNNSKFNINIINIIIFNKCDKYDKIK